MALQPENSGLNHFHVSPTVTFAPVDFSETSMIMMPMPQGVTPHFLFSISYLYLRFQDIMTGTVKITVLWDMVPQGLVDHYQHFDRTWCFHHHICNEKLKNTPVDFTMLFCLYITT